MVVLSAENYHLQLNLITGEVANDSVIVFSLDELFFEQ